MLQPHVSGSSSISPSALVVASPLLQLPLLYRLADVAEGMRHLHSRGILHGDLKSSNVLLATQSGAPFGQVAKVSDFGLSRALMDGQTHRSTRTLGEGSCLAGRVLCVHTGDAAGC